MRESAASAVYGFLAGAATFNTAGELSSRKKDRKGCGECKPQRAEADPPGRGTSGTAPIERITRRVTSRVKRAQAVAWLASHVLPKRDCWEAWLYLIGAKTLILLVGVQGFEPWTR